MRTVALVAISFTLLAACSAVPTSSAGAEARAAVAAVPAVLAADGPIGWTRCCDPEDFVMASDGVVQFSSFEELTAAMAAFAPDVAAMELRWQALDITPMSADAVWFGAAYDEALTGRDGAVTRFGGYCSGVVRRSASGFLITRLHWSRPIPVGGG